MPKSYHIFGLNIVSAIPLPVSLVNPQQPVPDITIEYGHTPEALLAPLFKGVRFQASPGEFLLHVDGIARYHAENGGLVTITPYKGASEDDILVFLMGSVMGALLHQRNILALHAAGIRTNGGAVIFTGPSGAGKSTMTAGFHRRGYSVLSDDVCALKVHNGHAEVLPGVPRLKLWGDALNKLEKDSDGLKRVRRKGQLEKYFLPVEDGGREQVPLHSIFILEISNIDKMEVIELQGREKIDPIIDNTYRRSFLEGLGGKTDHFKQCVSTAAGANVFRVIRPHGKHLLEKLLDKVESGFLP